MSDHLAELTLDQQHLVDTVAARLEPHFAGTFGPETIERFVQDSLERLLPTAKIATYLPVLAEKFARQRLTALARLDASAPNAVPGVLFMCVHNAGRSQMAAGWMRHLAGDRVVVWSGGSEPDSDINPAAVEAMAEAGIDITDEFPKPWTDEVVRAADVVVTMGCGDACPSTPAPATRTGTSTIPPTATSLLCVSSATRSADGSKHSWTPYLSSTDQESSTRRTNSTRPSEMLQWTHRPRLSPSMSPASARMRVWWLTVG